MSKRPSWDQYFLNLAHVVKDRSNCLRMAVGVVVVKDKHIIATGYNGTPAGIKNCFDGGCKRCLHRHENKIKPGERKSLALEFATESKKSKLVIPLSEAKVDELYKTKFITVVVSFTTASTTQHLKIYNNYSFDIQLVGDFNYTLEKK